MNNKKIVKKIAFNISVITSTLLIGVVLSKEQIDTKIEYINVSSLIGTNVLSNTILIKSKKRKEKN